MNLEVFMLADYAQVKGGLFNIVGGGITKVPIQRFPGNIPQLAVAIRLKISPTDLQDGYVVGIELHSPSGLGVMPPAKLDIFGPGDDPSTAHKEVAADFVYRLPTVVLPEPGTYTLTLNHGPSNKVDVVGTLSFEAVTQPSLNLVSAEVGDERIQAGFDAFRSGDVKAAEQLLRDVLQDDESNPQAHNNLGFILMCQHKYPAASQEFSRARELGYSELPIWSVNLGCCFYGLGEYEQAAKVFEQSLAMSSPTYAVLCAISDTDLKAVSLTSASNLVALVSLNIAWALARLRKPKDARKHADVSARLLDQIEGDDRSYFDQSLLRLQAFVKGLTTPS